jgi:hypothetical protein
MGTVLTLLAVAALQRSLFCFKRVQKLRPINHITFWVDVLSKKTRIRLTPVAMSVGMNGCI